MGDRNVIFAREADAAQFVSQDGVVYGVSDPESQTIDRVWNLLRAKHIANAVTIPHHTADKEHPLDWNYHDPHYQCVTEIFQSRGSFEYEGCPRQAPSGHEPARRLRHGRAAARIQAGDYRQRRP